MTNLVYKIAEKEDLIDIVSLLYKDDLGKNREAFNIPLPQSYLEAFENINNDPNQELIVVKFYEKQGFRASHEGMKLILPLTGKANDKG
ncbi:hypothetical protein [Sphingobacterium gobiense]|uniref:GNAT family N-acetyltransferase n=1 Tax=Sphingobacterium gobiense TaxID=1382456 RepID=A0A2S9JUX8_9SPHI|nr:hypothetical protein [Sphingobacterium gobiense]PRD57079.1 hypothetical protein C5749_07700 [Sphingobacterium gobiense]